MHNWHSTRPGVYGLAARIIFHDIARGIQVLSHTYADNAVAYYIQILYFSSLKLVLCVLNVLWSYRTPDIW